jgi:hypothetical protein
MYEYIILEMSNQEQIMEISDQEILNTMTFNEFNLYPEIIVDSLDEINEILNDSSIEDHVFVPGDYLRVYVGNNQTIVRMYEIKKCANYLGVIDTEEQFFDPLLTPPQTPPHEGMHVVSPNGGKRKSKKNKKINKRTLTRKGGSGKKLDLRITDENGNELFVPVVKDKNGNLTYSEDANIFASIRSDGVPPKYSSNWKNFDTKALKNGGKRKNKTKKKSN